MVIIIRTLKQYDSELSGFGALIDGHWIKAKNGFRFGLGSDELPFKCWK